MSSKAASPQQVRNFPLRKRTHYLCRRFGVRPRQARGQNFLINEGAATRLAETAAEPGLPIVEIGAGLGALTVPLAAYDLPLVAVEIDRDLAEALSWLLADQEQVRVLPADFLKVEPGQFVPGAAVAIGNLPYGAAGAILQKLWAPESPFQQIIVTVQREVAQRLQAQPGTKAYGPLTVFARLHTTDMEILAQLGPQSFYPAPRVSSVALVMRRREGLPEDLLDYAAMQLAIRGAFGTRRKILSNSLKIALGGEAGAAQEVLQRAGLDGNRRGETLDLAELIVLANACYQQNRGDE